MCFSYVTVHVLNFLKCNVQCRCIYTTATATQLLTQHTHNRQSSNLQWILTSTLVLGIIFFNKLLCNYDSSSSSDTGSEEGRGVVAVVI